MMDDSDIMRKQVSIAMPGTNFQIDGVWTQVLLEHCVKQNLLDKADYDEMTIKLVCSR